MESNLAFMRVVEEHMTVATGAALAQDTLLDAALLTLHELVPGFTMRLAQHYQAMLPGASQHLGSTTLDAFYQRADSIRHRLEMLQRVPR